MKIEDRREINVSKPIPPLEEVLAYKNEDVIYKFLENYDIDYEIAEDIFNETKKWLWLCAKSMEMNFDKTEEEKFYLFIDESMLIIDEMWHTFVLFTNDYLRFCKSNFGQFLHHAPTTKSQKDSMQERYQKDRKAVLEEAKLKTRNQYSFIYDALGEKMGEETLNKWYKTYAQRFTRPNIHYMSKRI